MNGMGFIGIVVVLKLCFHQKLLCEAICVQKEITQMAQMLLCCSPNLSMSDWSCYHCCLALLLIHLLILSHVRRSSDDAHGN